MAFFEAVRLALQTIRAQKLKSAFSIIGVFIGVMFLIAVVSVVQGMNRGASALTGVGFGLYPASRAARLDPVEALRYE